MEIVKLRSSTLMIKKLKIDGVDILVQWVSKLSVNNQKQAFSYLDYLVSVSKSLKILYSVDAKDSQYAMINLQHGLISLANFTYQRNKYLKIEWIHAYTNYKI